MLKLGTLYVLRADIPTWTQHQNMRWSNIVHWIPIDSFISIIEMNEDYFIVHTHLGVFITLENWLGGTNAEEVA